MLELSLCVRPPQAVDADDATAVTGPPDRQTRAPPQPVQHGWGANSRYSLHSHRTVCPRFCCPFHWMSPPPPSRPLSHIFRAGKMQRLPRRPGGTGKDKNQSQAGRRRQGKAEPRRKRLCRFLPPLPLLLPLLLPLPLPAMVVSGSLTMVRGAVAGVHRSAPETVGSLFRRWCVCEGCWPLFPRNFVFRKVGGEGGSGGLEGGKETTKTSNRRVACGASQRFVHTPFVLCFVALQEQAKRRENKAGRRRRRPAAKSWTSSPGRIGR